MASKPHSAYTVPMVRLPREIFERRNALLQRMAGDGRNTKLHRTVIQKIIAKYEQIDLEKVPDRESEQMISIVIPDEYRDRLTEIKRKLGLNFTQLYLSNLIDVIHQADLI